ncbi:MAG TPA: efflux RND transporter periplasmic adaptor subunit [Candidatus Binataceae bacterium]|nr:efflux RND transporter periplasmic adaptor subunit [Candidatus Binataceae bacterium]
MTARGASPRIVELVLALGLLLAAGCNGAKPRGDDTGDAAPNVVLAVSGARVVHMPLTAGLHLLGTTAAQRHLTVRAPTAGRIIDFALKSGDAVHRGQVVARVINREVEAAQNGLAVARTLDPSEAPAFAAALKRNRAPAAIAVTAPTDAVVFQPLVSDGQMVAELDPLADLIDPRSVYVEAAAPLDELGKLRPGMAARVTSPLAAGVQYPARVAAFSPSFAAAGATAPVRIEFSSAARITLAGAPVEVAVTTASVAAAIVVPVAALFDDATSHTSYVFIAGADGIAHRTTVTTGIRVPGEVQILGGLTPGEVVITSGGFALSDGLHVKVALPQS